MKPYVAAAIASASLISTAPAAWAQSADTVFGTWLHPANGGNIEMANCADKLCAKIVSIPNNDPPKTDKNNPDETKRDRPIIGMMILENAYKADEKSWKGSIYSPEDGKLYDVTVTPKSPAEIDVKGCVLSYVCRTQTWTRLP
jgi:uncharacterized protein (DUF2147 family)